MGNLSKGKEHIPPRPYVSKMQQAVRRENSWDILEMLPTPIWKPGDPKEYFHPQFVLVKRIYDDGSNRSYPIDKQMEQYYLRGGRQPGRVIDREEAEKQVKEYIGDEVCPF